MIILRPRRWSGAAVSAILAFLWAWMGLAYHLAFFTSISPPAYAFAAVFVAGALVFFWQGVVRRRLEFEWTAGARGMTGLLLVVYALVVYPAWSYFDGRPYLETPTFGLPCPTTIFTMGLLACLKQPYPRSIFVGPILWTSPAKPWASAAWTSSGTRRLGCSARHVVRRSGGHHG